MPTNVYGKKNLEWRMCEHRPQTQGKDRSKVQEARGGKDEDAKTNRTENREGKYLFWPLWTHQRFQPQKTMALARPAKREEGS